MVGGWPIGVEVMAMVSEWLVKGEFVGEFVGG